MTHGRWHCPARCLARGGFAVAAAASAIQAFNLAVGVDAWASVRGLLAAADLAFLALAIVVATHAAIARPR